MIPFFQKYKQLAFGGSISGYEVIKYPIYKKIRLCILQLHINYLIKGKRRFQNQRLFFKLNHGSKIDAQSPYPCQFNISLTFQSTITGSCDFKAQNNRIGSVLVSVLASSAVDRGFETRSGQTKDYKIGTGCFSANIRH